MTTQSALMADAAACNAVLSKDSLRDVQGTNAERRHRSRVNVLRAVATGAHTYSQIGTAIGRSSSAILSVFDRMSGMGLHTQCIRDGRAWFDLTDAGHLWLAQIEGRDA